MADVNAAFCQHYQSKGWKLAMETVSDLIEMMVRWDCSLCGVYETYEAAFEIATQVPFGTSAEELFKLWLQERGENV